MFQRRLTLAATLLIGFGAFAADTPLIDQTALLKRIEAKDLSLIVLDVRTPEEYAAGHVPGAINIPYTELAARISELPGLADKDVVVYCQTGVRAERAAASFKESGFTRLLHLEGDMKAWKAKERPLEK